MKRFPIECEFKEGGEKFVPTMIDFDNQMVWRQFGQASENGSWVDMDDLILRPVQPGWDYFTKRTLSGTTEH